MGAAVSCVVGWAANGSRGSSVQLHMPRILLLAPQPQRLLPATACNPGVPQGKVFSRWFRGGKTNMCYNCLDRHVVGFGFKGVLLAPF